MFIYTELNTMASVSTPTSFIPENHEWIVLISSDRTERVIVDKPAAMALSVHLKELICDEDGKYNSDDNEFQLLDVNSRCLVKIGDYINHFNDGLKPSFIPKCYCNIATAASKWEQEFVDVPPDYLRELLFASSYLMMPSLEALVSIKLITLLYTDHVYRNSIGLTEDEMKMVILRKEKYEREAALRSTIVKDR